MAILAVLVGTALGVTAALGSNSKAGRVTAPKIANNALLHATVTPDSCGYSGQSTTPTDPRSSLKFNEFTTAKGITLSLDASGHAKTINMFYSDEHALTLGQFVNANSPTPFAVEFTSGTNKAGDAGTGTNGAPATVDVGNTSSVDGFGRPIYPAAYITDLTVNGASSKAGDWQNKNASTTITDARHPDAVLGMWKNQNAADPKIGNTTIVNNQFLGPNADAFSNNITANNEKYGAEVRYDVATLIDPATGNNLIPGHTYRVQVIVHDGDQNNAGGDVGEGCKNVQIPGPPPLKTDATGQTANIGAATVNAHIKEPKGSSIKDAIFVQPNSGFPNPTGTVTTHLYFVANPQPANPADPTTGACIAGNEVTTGGFPQTNSLTVGNPSTAVTSTFTDTLSAFPPGGTYYWQSTYNGDANYTTATETCGTESDTMVDARVRATPNEAVNIVGNDHTVTLHVETTEDGTNFTAVSGAHVVTSLLNNTAGAVYNPAGANTCDTGAAGTCTVVITSNTVGSVDVHATSTFTQTGVIGSFTRSTGAHSTGDDTTDARKTYINPKTTLTVGDTLTGLDASMNGEVTYTAFTDSSCSLNPQSGGTKTVTNGVAPISDNFTIAPGDTLYFQAVYKENGVTKLTTDCAKETASSQ